MIPTVSYDSARLQKANAHFGSATALPWDIRLAQNQVLNRVVMDAAGPIPWEVALSRTKYERVEHILSAGSYLGIGIALPWLLGRFFNNWYTQNKLAPKFNIDAIKRPLSIPFKHLEHNGIQTLMAMPKEEQLKELGKYGIREFTPALAASIRRAKLQIILLDLMAFAIKGQVFYFGRNWLTKKWSGKDGFSGILNQANDQYLKKKTENYNKTKKKRLITSSVLSISTALAVPALTLAILKSPKAIGSGITGVMKKWLPKLDYHQAIYMSKELFLLMLITNYNIPKLLASRDSNEFRENTVRMGVHDAFYFVGDGVLTSMIAWYLQKKHADKLGNIPIVTMKKRFGITMPFAEPYHKIFDAVEQDKNHLAFKLARKSFWVGFAGTTFLLGISIPLFNRWYTRKKVNEEQSQLNKSEVKASQQPAFNITLPVKRPQPV